MMSDELLPCPFCGGDEVSLIANGIYGWRVSCHSCRIYGEGFSSSYRADEDYSEDKKSAIKAWNTRATPIEN